MGTVAPVIPTRSHPPELLPPVLRELAARGIPGELPVRGASMQPTLLEGDRVRVVPAQVEDVRVGDIVVRTDQGGAIIHRCVGWWSTRQNRRMLTKGDAAHRLDPPLGPEHLAGRVVVRVRGQEIRRLDGAGMRLRGRGRASVSLSLGLLLELWDRTRRALQPRSGWPPD